MSRGGKESQRQLTSIFPKSCLSFSSPPSSQAFLLDLSVKNKQPGLGMILTRPSLSWTGVRLDLIRGQHLKQQSQPCKLQACPSPPVMPL